MKVLLLNYYNEKFKPLYDVSKSGFTELCKNKNYTHNEVYLQEEDYKKIMMSKLSVIYNTLITTNADYIIYSDIDVKIIDPHFDIFEKYNFNKDITFSRDCYGLCAGFMVIKVSDFSKQFFSTCMYLGCHSQKECEFVNQLLNWDGKYDTSDDTDQELIKSLYYSYPNIRDNVDVELPEWIISNPMSTEPGIFAHHYWTRTFGIDQTIELLNNNNIW